MTLPNNLPTLVIADHDGVTLKPSVRSVITAAKAFGQPIHVLLYGDKLDSVILDAKKLGGVDGILVADSASLAAGLAEDITPVILEIAPSYGVILTASTTTGKNILPRLAAKLDVQAITDVIAIDAQDTFRRPIYAGNAIATVQTDQPQKLLTVRATAFDGVALDGNVTNIQVLNAPTAAHGTSKFLKAEIARSDRPELTNARVVISGGRGLGSAEAFKLLEPLANRLNAAIGASRAAVDAGYVPNDYQVGQTGKIVAPDLYIAVGISGAIQHLAGMSGSKVIVAINKDPDAPIFAVADYGLVADLFTALPELEKALDG